MAAKSRRQGFSALLGSSPHRELDWYAQVSHRIVIFDVLDGN